MKFLRKLRWVGWPLAWLGYMACSAAMAVAEWFMEHVFGAYADWCRNND